MKHIIGNVVTFYYDRPTTTIPVSGFLISQKNNAGDEPYKHMEQAELSQDLRLAITKLEPKLKQLVILKYYWDLNNQEIAT